MTAKYTENDWDRYLGIEAVIDVQLARLLVVAGGSIEGLTILDLGCGSVNSEDKHGSDYEPWLCRFLHEAGYNIIGIDLAEQKDESFEHYSTNLARRESLNFLASNSVDIANARQLFDSPTLLRLLNRTEQIACDKMVGRTLTRHLTKQLERIVKPQGYFIYT